MVFSLKTLFFFQISQFGSVWYSCIQSINFLLYIFHCLNHDKPFMVISTWSLLYFCSLSFYLKSNKPSWFILSLWMLQHHVRVRPRYSNLSLICVPDIWVILIISGNVEQSRINCIIRVWFPLDRTESIVSASCTLSVETLLHNFNILSRVSDKAGQWRSICSSEPSAGGEHVGRRQTPVLFMVQCLWSLSVKYLPDNILEAMLALWDSNGLDPHIMVGQKF